jgi:hypothetical protein
MREKMVETNNRGSVFRKLSFKREKRMMEMWKRWQVAFSFFSWDM